MTSGSGRVQALLQRLPPTAHERAVALRSDPGIAVVFVEILVATAHVFNATAVADFGGRFGPVRDRGLVEQVIAAALQTFGSVDPHPSPYDKAAMLFRGITQGHPFTDGNKRTGFLVAAYFLDLLGQPLPAAFDLDGAESLGVAISSGAMKDIDQIAAELVRLWQADPRPSSSRHVD